MLALCVLALLAGVGASLRPGVIGIAASAMAMLLIAAAQAVAGDWGAAASSWLAWLIGWLVIGSPFRRRETASHAQETAMEETRPVEENSV